MIMIGHSPVHSDPKIVSGVLVFRNTRVFAQSLLDYVNAGNSVEDFLEDFPSVDRDHAIQFLEMTREDRNS